ncbi:MAG: hypothetical protein IS632_02495 [Thaumarchaeota archaeon]|nr:hypothetical protein [Nitrososphaerota archaeon]
MARPEGTERRRAEEIPALAEGLEKILMRREAHVQETLKIVRARIRDLDDFPGELAESVSAGVCHLLGREQCP